MSNASVCGALWPEDAFCPPGAANDPIAESRKAWAQLGAAILGLVLLAACLPIPWSLRSWSSTPQAGPGVAGAVDAAVLLVSAVTVWLLLAWAAAVAGMVGLATLPGAGGRLARRWLSGMAPGAVRRLLVAAVGVTVITGMAGCATSQGARASTVVGKAAAEGSAVQAQSRLLGANDAQVPAQSAAGTVRGGPFPRGAASPGCLLAPAAIDSGGSQGRRSLPGTPTSPRSVTTIRTSTTPGIDVDWPDQPGVTPTGNQHHAVVVHRGDNLWAIAARWLPGDATDEQIDAAWRAWYATNRTVIGSDPDLILPGQQLLSPSSGTGHSS